MSRILSALFILIMTGLSAQGQSISVDPSGVNVHSHGATTVFLTYGRLGNYRPAEACWAGEIVPAAPDIGLKPDPSTIFGCLPARYDRSRQSAIDSFTDIMSIPPSVARRAYEAATAGADSRFFYVRRFVSAAGEPDQFVAVTCRLTGGGARTPFSLTDVKLSFDTDKTVMMVRPGEKLPPVKAEITYTGTGRLKGRWEVVLPGEEIPSETDLLTEATLPVEQRSLQRRYTQLSRFNLFLPPAGRFTLAGPDVSRLPSAVEGPYMILLRVEASDDRESDSDLAIVGAGTGVAHSGAVAGFPLPPLRYYVGSGLPSPGTIRLLSPVVNETRSIEKSVEFHWMEAAEAALYRLEVAAEDGSELHSALLPAGIIYYKLPSFLASELSNMNLRWRIAAFDKSGKKTAESQWSGLRLSK